jgi:hypothetical protein
VRPRAGALRPVAQSGAGVGGLVSSGWHAKSVRHRVLPPACTAIAANGNGALKDG